MCSCYNSCFFKKDFNYRNNRGVRLHDGDLEHSLMKEKKIDIHIFFCSFLFSGISDLALEILTMLIRVCFRNVFTTSGPLICSWYDMTLSHFVQ